MTCRQGLKDEHFSSSSQGLIAEGDDELAVFRTCGQQGLQRGQFVVARVEPDLPPAEITENWFPAAAQEA